MADEKFSGDMSRNEVEIDLNKFMELVTENSNLKAEIVDLKANKEPDNEEIFKLIAGCLEVVYDDENVYDDFTTKEALSFIKSFDIKRFEKLKEFFDTLPKLTYELNYKNKEGNDRKIVLNGIADFF